MCKRIYLFIHTFLSVSIHSQYIYRQYMFICMYTYTYIYMYICYTTNIYIYAHLYAYSCPLTPPSDICLRLCQYGCTTWPGCAKCWWYTAGLQRCEKRQQCSGHTLEGQKHITRHLAIIDSNIMHGYRTLIRMVVCPQNV